MSLALWVLMFFTVTQPCPTCRGKTGWMQYSIVYEVSEPRWSDCWGCDGRGWIKKRDK
jgi:hypothetical protein